MSVLSGETIRLNNILNPLSERTKDGYNVSYGLGPAGYDLRLVLPDDAPSKLLKPGEFTLAATMERFKMPTVILGIVHDKSTWARRGLSVYNTVIEPGWEGFLTLELVNHGPEPILLKEGQGIAQVIFHWLDQPTDAPYEGKYQDQEAGPQGAR